MSQLPEVATLDTLVIGTDEAEERAAWEALVRLPGGADAWDLAVMRRRRMDLLASAVRGRAWLATFVHRLSSLSRRVGVKPAAQISLEFPDALLHSFAGASLGTASGNLVDREVRPRWGATVPVHVRLGERITLNVVTDDASVEVRYLIADGEGPLPSRTWCLDSGEGPVLLVALVGADPRSSLADAFIQATAAAAVLLVERPADLKDP